MDYKVDKALLIQRIIIVSWVALGLCFIVKIFGGNFFEIICQNENYKALCEYADTHFWAKLGIGFISSMLCECLYLLAILQKYKLSIKQFVATAISVLISCIVQILFVDWSFITDIWIFFVLPCLFIGREYKKYWQILIAWIFTFVFQLVSLLTKNINSVRASDTLFVGLIYMIDLYIMCLLYYLYRNYQKEKKEMGFLWGMFAGKPDDKLRAMKAKREKQIAKYNEEIKAIETELARQEGEKK